MKLKYPALFVLSVYTICFVFRIIEYFVIRTDQTFWGEAFLHKLAGIAVLFTALRLLAWKPEFIGFAKTGVLKHILMGLLFGTAVYIIAYGAESLMAISRGGSVSLKWYVTSYAVDGNVGNQTGVIFFIICILGNIINVIMEEGVFRGLFQKLLVKRYSFLISAVIASVLFGLWHVIGPIRNYYDGLSSLGGMNANIIMLVITSGLVGLKCALVTKMTGSLYMAMADHFVNNAIVNLLHVVSASGADEFMFIRITIAQMLSFLVVLGVYLKKWRVRRVHPA